MISAKKTAKMQSLILLKQLGKILGVRIYPILRYWFCSNMHKKLQKPELDKQ
jgi:hypothetical protein